MGNTYSSIQGQPSQGGHPPYPSPADLKPAHPQLLPSPHPSSLSNPPPSLSPSPVPHSLHNPSPSPSPLSLTGRQITVMISKECVVNVPVSDENITSGQLTTLFAKKAREIGYPCTSRQL